jgi:hypothetical protein
MSLRMNILPHVNFRWSAYAIAFVLILAFGVWFRFWELGSVPSGLNQDEASIGLEAYSLYHYGVDRNAISFPVNFVSWGSGMDALYIYLVVPFIGLGLTPFVERLPMAISGVLTLPLVYFIGKRCIGERFGLLAMFFVAISPWHIMLSHWGLNDNILAFTFTLGVAMILLSRRENFWFPAGMGVFAISLYAYGAAYVVVPVFVLCTSLLLWRTGMVSRTRLAIGWGVFALVALPIALFVLINMWNLDSIQLGLLSIPHLPVKPRFEHVGILFTTDLLKSIRNNFIALGSMLWLQTDDVIWNTLPRYGYGYPGAILFAGVGGLAYLLSLRRFARKAFWILPIWLVAALAGGIALEVNINRLNLLFLPILFFLAALIELLFIKFRGLAYAALMGYLGLALLFAHVYFGGRYNEMAGESFFEGLVPALQSADRYPGVPVCVTDDVNMPYIYALWVHPADPRVYLPTITYADPQAQFRHVTSMGRFTFGVKNCAPTPKTIYVLKSEPLPGDPSAYREETYSRFHIYIPLKAGAPAE